MSDPNVPFNRLSAADALVLLADVVAMLRANSVIAGPGADGHYTFATPPTEKLIGIAAAVEAILRTHGVVIPADIDRVLTTLGAVLPLLLAQRTASA